MSYFPNFRPGACRPLPGIPCPGETEPLPYLQYGSLPLDSTKCTSFCSMRHEMQNKNSCHRQNKTLDWEIHSKLEYNLETRGVTPVHSFLIGQVLQKQPVASPVPHANSNFFRWRILYLENWNLSLSKGHLQYSICPVFCKVL